MKVGPLGAALGLAALIGGTATAVVVARHHGGRAPIQAAYRVPPATPPLVTGTPRPLVPPPAGVDLLWRTLASNGRIIEAVDWSGVVRGRLALPDDINHLGTIAPSPNGQRILISIDNVDHVYTAQGADLGTVSGGAFPADDGDVRFCALSDSQTGRGFDARLSLQTLGKPERVVADITWPSGGDGGARIAACSVANDLAVISLAFGDDTAGHVVDVKVLRLSTGATIRDLRPPSPDFRGSRPRPVPGSLADVTASADGRLMALSPYTGMMDTSVPFTTQIVDTVSGRLLGSVQGSVFGFTDDDAAVFTDRGIVNWKTGRVLLGRPMCCDGLVDLQPGGTSVVLAVPSGPLPTAGTAAHPAEAPPDDYILMRPDGSSMKLACCGARVL